MYFLSYCLFKAAVIALSEMYSKEQCVYVLSTKKYEGVIFLSLNPIFFTTESSLLCTLLVSQDHISVLMSPRHSFAM